MAIVTLCISLAIAHGMSFTGCSVGARTIVIIYHFITYRMIPAEPISRLYIFTFHVSVAFLLRVCTLLLYSSANLAETYRAYL